MSRRRVQVLLDEKEASQFKAQAMKECQSLSAWLRDAGRKKLEMSRQEAPLADVQSLKAFFDQCDEGEKRSEPDWEEHKRMILDGSRGNPTL